MRSTEAQKNVQTERTREAVKAYPDGTLGICIVIRRDSTCPTLEVETALVARNSDFIDKETVLWALSNVLDALTDLPPNAVSFDESPVSFDE